LKVMEVNINRKRSADDVISYLLESKKQLQDEIRNDVDTKEFKEAIARLKKQIDGKA